MAAIAAVQQPQECPQCLDDLIEANTTTTKCNHLFCTDCITDWTTNHHDNCPLCRMENPLGKKAIEVIDEPRTTETDKIEESIFEPIKDESRVLISKSLLSQIKNIGFTMLMALTALVCISIGLLILAL